MDEELVLNIKIKRSRKEGQWKGQVIFFSGGGKGEIDMVFHFYFVNIYWNENIKCQDQKKSPSLGEFF